MNKEIELLKKILATGWLDHELSCEVEELLDQPESEQEPVAWMYEWHEGDTESTSTYCGSEKPFQEDEVKPFNLRPLYEHPKSNELTPRQGLKEYKKGYARAEVDLKREPLSEEESYHEAKRLYEAEDGLWYADGFVDGLKFAEKMHGIGVGNV
jgi:hypothetical protein